MKIGIVTQPLLNNYGGVLQNFAMQTVLRGLGHEPVTIDYTITMSRVRFVKVWLRNLLYNLFHSSKRSLPKSRVIKSRKPHFESFVAKNIATTQSVEGYSTKLISEYGLEAVVVGSDQVWRPCYNRRVLTNMFLDFVGNSGDVKKIAYAASFGVDHWEYKPRKAQRCSILAKRIEHISVREESGVLLCRSYLGVKATEVLDPTLLLTADDYCAVCASVEKSEERYIAAYILDPTPEKNALVEREAKRRGVTARVFGADKEANLSVEEWLAMFRDAEYIITDSFHGCVFSTIFRRDFAVVINRDRGASRFVSLLGKLNLLDRTIIDAKRAKVPTEPIRWQDVEQELQKWQELSTNFLKQALCR